MNTYILSLSSTTPTSVQFLTTIDLIDHTRVILDVSDVDNTLIPLFMKVNWGEGESEIFDNNILAVQSSILDPLLNGSYYHEYFPSRTAQFKLLSAQVLIQYSNEQFFYALIPFQIRTKDFFESIGDMDLINTNILPIESSASEHQFKTYADGYIIELRGD